MEEEAAADGRKGEVADSGLESSASFIMDQSHGEQEMSMTNDFSFNQTDARDTDIGKQHNATDGATSLNTSGFSFGGFGAFGGDANLNTSFGGGLNTSFGDPESRSGEGGFAALFAAGDGKVNDAKQQGGEEGGFNFFGGGPKKTTSKSKGTSGGFGGFNF